MDFPRHRPRLQTTIAPDLRREIDARAVARGVAVARVVDELIRRGLEQLQPAEMNPAAAE